MLYTYIVYMYIYVYILIYVYKCIYVNIYVYIYIYIPAKFESAKSSSFIAASHSTFLALYDDDVYLIKITTW
jgi:hypothetical protein